MSEKRGEHILQEENGTKKRAFSFYNNQMLSFLNELMREFIIDQDMMFISTADNDGNCDNSFRAGEKGFVKIIDEHTLMYPEYKGNGVMSSLGNIVENPHIGLLFIDFFEHRIGLHVNGKAKIIEHEKLSLLNITEDYLSKIESEEGQKAERWVVIEVEEAYIHCSKHIPLLKRTDHEVGDETDNKKVKGGSGDFFRAKQSKHNP
ncbi:pyridoxamine 5'-phosphate oxidase family protein [Virgibacillus ihumii]|uniref:pyridoxamine 5'-phosphate oxidase family protein n=1 Tax=Virgibacillus ihumii TaxID=2686091 RepID=UPI00157BC9C7|nr:pyridoxamine 5'-phosphate oxidase family protein [Virgibacillus ihumii]